MALKFVQDINLNGLELQNVVLQPLTSAPTTLNSVGRMYFHSTDKKPYWYDGSKFITFPLLSDVTTLQGYFTNGKANDALKLGGVALDGLFTALSTSTTNAVSITVGGISKNITVADLKTSLGLKGLAYKDSLALSDIPAIPWDKITANTRPTTLAGYGITDAASGVNGIATSASKLAKNVSLWGQSFDGTQDVKGTLSNVDSISFTNDNIEIVNLGSIYIRAAATGGWNRGIRIVDRTADKTTLGTFGAFGVQESLMYLYMGTDFNSVNTLRVYPNGSVTIGYHSTESPEAKLYVNGSVKIGGATFTWDETNGVLIVDKPFASTGAISTKGVGSSSGGGGSVDLTKVVSNILPTNASTYTVGSSALPWKSVYADELYAGNLNVGSAISSLQTTVGQHGSNIQDLLTAVNNIQTNYAERSYVDSAVDEVYKKLLGEDDTTEAIDSIKEVLALVENIKKENLVFKYTETITGDGEQTSFTIDHNLGTKDVVVFVYEVSSPYQQVYVDVKMANTEYLTVEFAEAPKTTEQYKVVVIA